MTIETIQYVPLERFKSDEKVRVGLNMDLVEQIAQSFATVGQLQPVRARASDEWLLVVDGHHRVAAAHKAGRKTLACIIEDQPLAEGDVIQRQLIANCQRSDLTALEVARGIEQLIQATGWSANQVGQNLGFSHSKVSGLRKLLGLPQGIIEQIEAGRIPVSAAYELARIDDAGKQAEVAEELAAGRLTRDGAAGARKAAKRGSDPKVRVVARATALMGGGRSITIAAPELTLERLIVLVEELLSKARRERARGTELGTFVSLLRDQAQANP